MKYLKISVFLIALIINHRSAIFCANIPIEDDTYPSFFQGNPTGCLPIFIKYKLTQKEIDIKAAEEFKDALEILKYNIEQKDSHSAIKNFNSLYQNLNPQDLINHQDLKNILRLTIANKFTNFFIPLLTDYQCPLLIIKQINHILFLVTLKAESDIKEPLLILTRDEIDLSLPKDFISNEQKTAFYKSIQQATDSERVRVWKESGLSYIEQPR